MDPRIIALFGEAEKGEYSAGYLCTNLVDLVDSFGNPPADSRGLHLAVQALLFQHYILFFRVKEEGFSEEDYLLGLNLLTKQSKLPHLEALAIPGVGSNKIIAATTPICEKHHSILLMTEADLYDYLHAA